MALGLAGVQVAGNRAIPDRTRYDEGFQQRSRGALRCQLGPARPSRIYGLHRRNRERDGVLRFTARAPSGLEEATRELSRCGTSWKSGISRIHRRFVHSSLDAVIGSSPTGSSTPTTSRAISTTMQWGLGGTSRRIPSRGGRQGHDGSAVLGPVQYRGRCLYGRG